MAMVKKVEVIASNLSTKLSHRSENMTRWNIGRVATARPGAVPDGKMDHSGEPNEMKFLHDTPI
jgi:hypothetical protein